MEKLYTKQMKVPNVAVDCFGRLKPSMLLFYCQDIAGHHCTHLGTDYDTLAHRNLFWAVIRQEVAGEHSELLGASNGEYNGRQLFWAVTRHRVEIKRLPGAKEVITLKTWPCPTTRVAYPRATVAYDEEGNELFKCMSLWVLMDVSSRAMILPGKSGVTVDGITLGGELAAPGSLVPVAGENREMRQVRFTDLDVNGHMNNTQYLTWVEDLLPVSHHKDHPAKAFTVCYLSEALEGQTLELHWSLGEDLQVDAKSEDRRIFAAKVTY